MKKFEILITLAFLSFLLNSCSKFINESPQGLMVNLLRYPEKAVITDSNPEFSWIVPNTIFKQTAYRILVASEENLIKNNKGDFWDSGKTNSDKSVSISYNGKSLESKKSYFWKVKIWDSVGKESDFSESQKFITSDLSAKKLWPGQSEFVKIDDSTWISENRQTATFHKIAPTDSKQIDSNKYFTDFGKAAFGTLEISVNSNEENDSIIVYLGERKNNDYTVNKNPGRSNIGFGKFIVKLNKGLHNYKIEIPKHHSNSPNHQELAPFYPEVLPFRFVEINSNNKFEVKKIQQLALFYPFDDSTSCFKSSNKNLNKIWDLCKYSLKATPFLGVYADGNRERMPYEADSYIQQLGHYSVDREYSIARYTNSFLIYNPAWPTEWQMHTVLIAWEDYMYSGDESFLAKNYDVLKNKTLIALERDDGLISTTTGKVTEEFLKSINLEGKKITDIVDWPKGTPKGETQAGNAGPTPEGERDGYVFTSINTVVNAFHYRSLVILSKIAKVLNKEDDELFFNERSEKVKHSILTKLFDIKKGLFIDGEGTDHSSLHANIFPLAFNIIPDQSTNKIIEFIKSKGMACSVYGAQYLLDALFNLGEAEYAISLITSESKRSWMNMINVGSTMTTEAWDEYYKPNLTWNHAWGSAPANIIVRRLAGIKPNEAGFKTFAIVPQPGNLKEINLKTPSIRGEINYELQAEQNKWELNITVPGNSEAYLYLPLKFQKVIIDEKSEVSNKSEYKFGEEKKIFILQSGEHKIVAEYNN
ncbi:MAG: family 78 glycoside hydrolase catalytic domain [Ignavibacteriales bacterium]|nr:family 78 glycoside hydrolase catalytic domain [Ignavibacteriales bacterium]MCB9208770.1 family 78 glycoside hydrolase catalytic domain [Ignavibacteriales bacterium]MCB9218312.1 family 78 glycoside hydrolase catalytic domain [Ignavibacteriales bacterium]